MKKQIKELLRHVAGLLFAGLVLVALGIFVPSNLAVAGGLVFIAFGVAVIMVVFLESGNF